MFCHEGDLDAIERAIHAVNRWAPSNGADVPTPKVIDEGLSVPERLQAVNVAEREQLSGWDGEPLERDS